MMGAFHYFSSALIVLQVLASNHANMVHYNCSDYPADTFKPINLVSESGALKLSFIPYGGTVTSIVVESQDGEIMYSYADP
jgi:hypothetical protein